MLVVREQQIETLRSAARERFEADLASHLREFFPRHVSFLGDAHLAVLVGYCIARARAHDFCSDYATFLYVDLAFMLGSHFDEDPQLTWVAALLQTGGGPLLRIERLHTAAMRYFDRVTGVDNEHWTRALVRARRLDLHCLDAVNSPSWNGECQGVLDRLYPEKSSHQGAEVNRRLVVRGRDAAAHYGLTRSADILCYIAHMFMLGSAFDRDPHFPWAQQIADASLDSSARMALVYEASMNYLNHALSR